MQIQSFPGCCGGCVIVGFGSGPEAFPDPETQLQDLIADTKGVAFVTAALNGHQREGWKSILYRNGFRRVAYGLNANHSSDVFLYALSNRRKNADGTDDNRLPEERAHLAAQTAVEGRREAGTGRRLTRND